MGQAVATQPMHATDEQRHALVLRAWEAINSERELQSVLEALAHVLTPIIPLDGVAIVSFEGEKHDLFAIHTVSGKPRPGESAMEFARRVSTPDLDPGIRKPIMPYEPHQSGDYNCYSVGDICAKDWWWEHEEHLVRGGIRSYASIALRVQGRLIGTSVFSRRKPQAFEPHELEILQDVSRALGVATANAIAYEEIRKLRDQLQEENIALRSKLEQPPWFSDVVGDSPALRRVLEAVEQVAPTDSTVLITGETGTGKELIARAVHRRSGRSRGPLVKVNCAAIPESLLASELFGHERGAFTGAIERRKGRFEQAHRGTLFLDEIGELPGETQVMLLRVLQEREFERLGGSETIPADVRVVVATNRNLAEEVKAGRFRSDLYYRLNVFPIPMPALRDHREDIPLLVSHFSARHGARCGKEIARVGRRTMTLLESYEWPGNVRELENVIERAVILSRGGTLRVDRSALSGAGSAPSGTGCASDIKAELSSAEREAIEAALSASRGRISGPNGAANRLGIPASTLEFRIRRLRIDKFQFKKSAR